MERPSPVVSAATVLTTPDLAGFWARVGAYIVDGFVIGLVTVGLYPAGSLGNALSFLLNLGYFAYFWSTGGDTLGMRWLGLRVVREDGQPLSLRTGVIRYFALFLASLPLGLGLVWAAFDSKKQGWHDKLAGTLVVKTRPTNGRLVIAIVVFGLLLFVLTTIAVTLLVVLTVPQLRELIRNTG